MKGMPDCFWGKLAQGELTMEWHPLIDHCADVSAVCETLLRLSPTRRRMAALGGRDDLTESEIQRLAALAAFHDVGKFNLGFQNKADRSRQPRAGHVQPLLDLFGPSPSAQQRELRRSLPLDQIQSWTSDGLGLELLIAAIAHHGKPGEPGGGSGPRVEIWRAEPNGRDPFAGIARLSAKVREWFPAAFAPDAAPLPATPRFQHAFCGLVTLADWIGSDRSVFRYSEPGDGDRIGFARHVAPIVLRHIGLDSAPARAAYHDDRREFGEIFEFAPNQAQRRMLELPIAAGRGSLAILESETGSGKTEAALARFFRLFDAGEADGLYFALPTRTAAVQMHRRIENAVARAFPGESVRPPVTLAVPGYLPLDDGPEGRRLAPFETLHPDDEAFRCRFRRWAGEHPKRYLAGAISVGTVDQSLLSALMVSHSHLRATAMLRQFLVVDEVHASDAYMTEILREALRFHLAAGGHALLLSATLGAGAAANLIGAALSSRLKLPPLAGAIGVPYPIVTTVVGGGRYPARVELMSESPPKTVNVEIMSAAGDFAAAASRALAAALAGARVLIVRNTVGDCVATQIELERIAGERNAADRLFALNGIPAPHHARFAREDRVPLDGRLEDCFGKNSRSPCVAAATQTVQQSLDLDADLMLTDLCPLDVMLQRIGRLHRHDRGARPEPFRAPRVIVLVPADRDLTPLIGREGAARGEHGFGTVYDDLRVLEATWRALETYQTLEIPAMNRRLVEAATHPEALKAIVAELGGPWKKHAQKCDGESIASRRLANLNAVDRDQPFADCRFPSSESRIRTRLGEDDRIVEFDGAPAGPFGAPIRRLTIPGWLAKGAPAEAQAEHVVAEAESIRFNFADRAFVYDRMGLRPAETLSKQMEESADD
jgi:CRISPR-associated endonuclease/helicase Cas3